MFSVGLTGGIASGKSAAAQLFAEHGVRLIDTDVIAREVVQPGSTGLTAVVKRFGEHLLSPRGELDRRALRALVFADPLARRDLDELLHPLIRARTVELMAAPEPAGHAEPSAYQVVVVPLLIETNFATLVNRVLVIDCPEAIQVERLVARDALSEADARRMLASQATREERLQQADDVINNTGTLASLAAEVAQLHTRYCKLAAAGPAR